MAARVPEGRVACPPAFAGAGFADHDATNSLGFPDRGGGGTKPAGMILSRAACSRPRRW